MRAWAVVLFVGGMLALASWGSAQPPGGQPGGKGGKGGFPGGKGGFGGFGGFFAPGIGQILPSFVQDQLKLTDVQKKELEALQKDVDAKLDKILTEEQRKQLKQMKERGPGMGGFPNFPAFPGFPSQPGDKGKGNEKEK